MSILKFAEDLSRLIILYTKTPVLMNKDPSDAVILLSEEQIVFTIRNVLNSFGIKNFDNQNTTRKMEIANNLLENFNNNNLLELSDIKLIDISSENALNNEITSDVTVACTPNNENGDQTDKLVSIDDNSFASDTLQKIQTKQENVLCTSPNENNSESQPNPVICVNNFNRSETFVCKEKQTTNKTNQEALENFMNNKNLINEHIQLSVNEIRQYISNIVEKLNKLEQSFLNATTWQNKGTTEVRKLSLNNDHSSSYRPLATSKKLPINNRKSSSTENETFKLLAVQNEHIVKRRKSTGGIEVNNTPAKKSCESKVNYSNLSSSSSTKTVSPVGSPKKFQQKVITKNPKYAHIQSTIPKFINAKKKL